MMPELWHCCVYLSLAKIKMRFPDELGKDIIISGQTISLFIIIPGLVFIYIYIENSIVLIGNFLYLGMCLPAGGGGPYFK